MITETQWIQLTSRFNIGSDPEKVYITIRQAPSDKVPKVFIKIGIQVCKKLGFALGDRIGVFYDIDDMTHLQLAKVSNGYKLYSDNSKNIYTVAFSYRLMPLTPTKKMVEDIKINLKAKVLQMHIA